MTAKRLIILATAFVAAALALAASGAAAQPLGRGCSVFNPCGSGFSCQPGHQRCYNSPRQEGQPCSLGFSCGGGLRCAAGVQRCVRETAPATGVVERGAVAVATSANAVAAAVIPTSCPDMALRCPTGEPFARGTSWDGDRALCRPSNAMAVTLRNKCPAPWAGARLGNRDLDAEWTRQAGQKAACSAPGILRTADSEVFNDACIIHDLCYRSRSTKGRCDVNFLYNQQAVCHKLGVPSALGVAGCLTLANNNYLVVLQFGQVPYDSAQKVFGLKQ